MWFNLKTELKKLKINYKKGVGIFACSTVRNTGKSTSSLKFCLDEFENFGHKFCYARTKGEQIKKFIASFNEEYRDKYKANENKIFKIVIEEDEKGKEKKSFEEVGSIFNLGTEYNYKSSGTYENYRYFLFDEFNDLNNITGLYESFTNLVETVQRKKKDFWIFLLGNKDTENNTFLVNWGIEIETTCEDQIYNLSNEMITHYYVDYAMSTFENIKNESGLSNHLSGFNDEMNRYINLGGFRKTGDRDVINYKLRVETSDNPKYYLSTRRTKFLMGEFGEGIYIKIVDDFEMNLPILALGFENALNISDANVLLNDEESEIAEYIFNYSSKKQLWYCSFDCKIKIEAWLHLALQKIIQ